MYRPVGCLSARQPATIAVPNVMVFRRAHSLAVGSARAVWLAKLSSAASAKTQPWQIGTGRMNEALTTCIPCIVPQCAGFDHYYASVASTCRGPKCFFLGLSFGCDHVMPTRTNETSLRSLGGGSVMASNSSSAARARVAVAIALQPVNTYEASNASCVNEVLYDTSMSGRGFCLRICEVSMYWCPV